MIRHHPSEITLLEQAAGRLPPLHARVLRVHLAACPVCRAHLRQFEEIGGALLEGLPPQAMRDGALTRILARLDDEADEPTPEPAGTTVAALATGRWWWIAPGIRIMPLARRDHTGTRLDLLRVAPGVGLPVHTHSGHETTCIIQGSYDDETGHYAVHDFAEGDANRRHQPVAGAGEECICIIAATGRLHPGSWLARAFMRLIRL